MNTKQSIKHIALVLVFFFTAVTAFGESLWNYQGWKTGWCSYGDRNSITYHDLGGGFPRKCDITEYFYDGGTQFKVAGTSEKKSKMTIMSLYSHIENVPSYTRRVLTWDYQMISYVHAEFVYEHYTFGHVQTFALYASENNAIKYASVDCTEYYTDGSGSNYLLSRLDPHGQGTLERNFTKTFTFDNSSSSTASNKEWSLLLAYSIFNSGNGHDLRQNVSFNTTGTSWKDYYYKEITFDPNGGSNSNTMSNQTIENSGTLNACTIKRDGYCFIGWNTKADGSGKFYKDQATIEANSNDKGPVTLYAQWVSPAKKLSADFNQTDNQVRLSWSPGSIPSNFKNYKWVIYRDNAKIDTCKYNTFSFVDEGMATETTHTYDIYFVSKNWNEGDKRDGTKASVTVDCTRKVPVKDLNVEQKNDRLVFTWSSDVYPKNIDNKFYIFIDGETTPVDTIIASEGQSTFQWEHRTTDGHTTRKNGEDSNGVPFTEEPLSVCSPHNYCIKGVIGSTVLNQESVQGKTIGQGTQFYDFDASKAVYGGSVKLTWHVNKQGSETKTYIVTRRNALNANNKADTLTQFSSAADYLSYTDETALPGVFYDYQVTVEDKCPDGSKSTNEIKDIGFAKSTGTVTGRIAYGSSGIAVKGVDVVMSKTDSEGTNKSQLYSMSFNDILGFVKWKYPSANYAAEKFAQKDFSIQMWLCPDVISTSTILKMGNKVFLYMTEDGKLRILNNANVKTFRDTLTANTYNHVTLTRKGTQMICYVITINDRNEPVMQKDTITLSGNLQLSDATELQLGHFKGKVDEFRLWTKCLSEEAILENYDHLLVGNEEGLETYWTFDEGLNTQFFDYSRTGTDYHKHHGSLGINTQPSTHTPAALALRAKTDADGNYVIQGVPFSEAGTTYTVTPLLGIHDFNPNKSVLFIGENSLVHNKTDFEDVSSFPMEGYIYYAGTNIPVEGVMLYVDGELVTANGEIKQTDAVGYYSISVPIGKHYVEAKKGGHTMVAGGRFPTQSTFNFDRAVIHDFADSTLVNFVGRVGGGERNDTLGVGFGASKNNIGIATVTLQLNNESLSFNCADDHISAAATNRTWESNTTSIKSTAKTGIGADSKYIYIRTDSLTGEFSALLPPLKYFTKSIRIDTNPDIEFSSLTEIDLTNPEKELKDSLEQVTEDGAINKEYYTYNTKMVKAYYAEPVVEMSQPGNAEGMFGMKEYQGSDQLGDFTVGPLWTQEKGYAYGFPIYNMGDSCRLSFFAYERYLNYDNGTSQPVEDIIPLNGKVLTIANEMSSSQTVVCVPEQGSDYQSGEVYDLKEDQIQLDDKGCATIKWMAGPPNVVAPYTRHLDVIMEQNGRTMVPASLDAIVVGGLPLGNNFVTQGPDKVLMVLRDPPGAKSRTIWKRGTTTTKIKTRVNGGFGDEKMVLINGIGLKFRTATGLGIMLDTQNTEITSNFGGGLHYRWTAENSAEEVWNVTTTQEVSTSSGSKYCGSNGDVFIGVSTNLLLGECRKVGFFRDNAEAPFALKDDVAMSVGDSVTTNFMYSTYELEEVMIPKWKDTRNSYLTQHVNTEEEAKAVVNNTNDILYVTWLKEDDENYGQGGTYLPVIPEAWKNTDIIIEDKVSWCNNQIESWRQVLANNEKDKVDAIDANQQYWKRNISFDGGSSYTYTEKKDTTKTKTISHTHNLGVIASSSNKAETAAGLYSLLHWSVDTENGYSRKEVDANKDYEFAEFDYVFDDGNPGTDFSVDVYKSPGGWSDLFRLFGGQSYNPYEGEEKTKYYEPGQHVLSNGTVQMEQPFIGVSTDGNIAAKQATLSDIPAGGTGQFTLHLTNGTTTNQSFNFSYNLSVLEKANQQGLEVLMDGVPVTGRSISIPAGETIKKVITVRQTDQSVLNYEDINIRFASPYQPNKIFDQCTLNVHFKPSSSPIDLVVTEPVINTESQNGKLSIKLTNFNRQFKNLRKVGVQYRFEGNTQWIDLHTWVTNKADSTSTAFNLLPSDGDIRYEVNMSNNTSYPEGNYEFRAFTTTPYGTEQINVYSDVIKVVKDMTRPRNLFTPSPANGILSYGDQLAIEFNEDIVPGYVSKSNVIVTAKLNQQTVNHEVALRLQPGNNVPKTENPVFLSGDFSLGFWLNWHESGTILNSGQGENKKFALGIDDKGHFTIAIAGNLITSTETLPKNEWIFLALSYKADSLKFDVLASYGNDNNVPLFNGMKVELTADQIQLAANNATDNYLYLGGIDADIHALSLYNIWRNVEVATGEKDQSKDGYVYGLANYWPMDEGHGKVAADLRHTHDFVVPDSWTLENVNYSLHLNDAMGAKDATNISTTRGDSYAIELWYKRGTVPDGATSKNQVVFNTGTLQLYYDENQDLVLNYNNKSQTVASHTDFPEDNVWRHMALNVVRGQAASFYLNGQRTAVIAEADVPSLEGGLTIGKNAIGAEVDEVRIWHAALSESRLMGNIYNAIDTADAYSRGLVAYYPFEKTGTINNVVTKVPTMQNMAKGRQNIQISASGSELVRAIPPVKNAPEESVVIATPVASERKVVINLTGASISPRDLEGTTLNITVDQVHDLHGNTSLPIRWTAYVQQNTLTWMKDSVNIYKMYGDDYTFDVDIENKSGNVEYYTLYNMPQWLSIVDSEQTDAVQPLKTKKLRFAVNPLVNIGNYDVTIGLQGNNEILEPLRIVMKVRGEMPDWAVDPTQYENQMTITGQLRIGGVLVENPDSRVAAFIDGVCRGVAAPKQMRGTTYVPLSIYGTAMQTVNGQQKELDKDQAITFRIWDANTGITYTNAQVLIGGTPTEITFDPSMSHGTFDNPVIFTKSIYVEQPLNLKQGWNWLSLGVEPSNGSTSVVFKDVTSWNVLLKDQDTGTQYCNGVSWGGTLNTVRVNKMYKMLLTRLNSSSELPQPLIVVGKEVNYSDSAITLAGNESWNWIPYTPMVTMTLDEALAGANPQQGDQVKSQYAFAYYGPYGWEGNLEALESGKGYLYQSLDTKDKTFVYPKKTNSSNRARVMKVHRAPAQFSPVDPTNYPDNMSMVVQLIDKGEPVENAELAVFINGECRGAAACNDGLYYLLIAGEGSGQPMEIRAFINGEIRTLVTSLTYSSDGNIGTPWEPFVIDLDNLTGIEDIKTAQRKDTWFRLDGIRLNGNPKQRGVYIRNGQKRVIN